MSNYETKVEEITSLLWEYNDFHPFPKNADKIAQVIATLIQDEVKKARAEERESASKWSGRNVPTGKTYIYKGD